MAAAGVHDAQVCLTLSDDAELHALNLQFAGEDHATDVLSFAQLEGLPPGVKAPDVRQGGRVGPTPTVLGDIVISVEMAGRQAAAQGHDLDHELLHLSVHGLCHLLGYDHATGREERVMFGYEAELREEAYSRRAVARRQAPEIPAAAGTRKETTRRKSRSAATQTAPAQR